MRPEVQLSDTAQVRAGGLVREVLLYDTAQVRAGGMAREVILTATAKGYVGGLVREVLVTTPLLIPAVAPMPPALRRLALEGPEEMIFQPRRFSNIAQRKFLRPYLAINY